MCNTRLFIGLSKNQVSSYEAIIFDSDNYAKNVLITNDSLSFDKTLWDEVIYADGSFNNRSSSIISSVVNIYLKIKQYKKIILKLQKFKRKKNITLYFTYIEDILTNYLLLSFNKNLKGIVVEDGTLNYYSHTIKNIPLKKRYLKWGLSNFMGVRFKIYKGHSSGIEYNHVQKQYVRVPELTLFSKKSVPLPYPTRGVFLSDTILIIGQEAYINMYGLEKYQKAVKELIQLIQNKSYYNEIETIYYKPHRNGQRIDYNRLKERFNGKCIEILEGDEPLEDLFFEKLGSKYIFSFDSSALLNIYLESSQEVKENLSFNVLLKYNKLLKPVFEKFNFNIYS